MTGTEPSDPDPAEAVPTQNSTGAPVDEHALEEVELEADEAGEGPGPDR